MILTHFINWLFPATCMLCHENASKRLTCRYCTQRLPWVNHQRNDNNIALFEYRPPVDQFIVALKFRKQLRHAHFFAEHFIEWMHDNRKKPLPTLLIPMPLHCKRLQQRGFNQSIEIARPLAKQLNMKLDITSCRRIKNTKPQTELPAKRRTANVKDAFQLQRPIQEKHVAILDDVITTGSTSQALYALLKNHGVMDVEIWTCARASA